MMACRSACKLWAGSGTIWGCCRWRMRSSMRLSLAKSGRRLRRQPQGFECRFGVRGSDINEESIERLLNARRLMARVMARGPSIGTGHDGYARQTIGTGHDGHDRQTIGTGHDGYDRQTIGTGHDGYDRQTIGTGHDGCDRQTIGTGQDG